MSATLLHTAPDVAVYHATHAELAEETRSSARRDDRKVDALILDAPYSERTHRAGDECAVDARDLPDSVDRRGINYGAWTPADVHECIALWAPITRGWMVTITDYGLAPAWEAAMLDAGRYVFSPLPFYSPGCSVRLFGDGPSSWTCWIVVSRPRSEPWSKWGTLPGGYSGPPERNKAVVGGKPLWLMERLCEDYARPGQLVCDPCCGGGTTLEAARRTGRRAIGGDAMLEHAKIAAARVARPTQRALFAVGGGK